MALDRVLDVMRMGVHQLVVYVLDGLAQTLDLTTEPIRDHPMLPSSDFFEERPLDRLRYFGHFAFSFCVFF